MQLDTKDVGPCKKALSFVLPASQVDKEFEEKYEEVTKTVPFPGFRVGKAPIGLIEKRFGEAIANDVTSKLVQTAFEETLEKNEWKIVGDAEFDIPDDPAERGKDYSFGVTFEVRPEITLGDYRGIEVEDPYVAPTDEDVTEAFAAQERSLSRLEDAGEDATVEAGDLVHCRISACVVEDGEEQEFYDSEEARIDLAKPALAGLPVPELGAALPGKHVDERGECTFVMPADYVVEEWRGLEASIAFEVLRIQRRVLSMTREELAAKLGFDSVDAWREAVKTAVEQRRRQEADSEIEEAVVAKLLETHQFDLPRGFVERLAHDSMHQGDEHDHDHDHTAHEGDPAWEAAIADAERQLRRHLLLETIAEEELIFVSDADMERSVEQMARRMGISPVALRRDFEGTGFEREMRLRTRTEKTLAFLRAQARIRS